MNRLPGFFRNIVIKAALCNISFAALSDRAEAHEVLPSIADFAVTSEQLLVTVRLDLEALMVGMDLSTPSSESEGEMAAYLAMRELPVSEIEARFPDFWPIMAKRIKVLADGVAVDLTMQSVAPPTDLQAGLARISTLVFSASLPARTQAVSLGWDATFGPLVLRQNGVDDAYDGYLDPGEMSPPIQLSGGDSTGGGATFLRFIPVGFDHIVPQGLDHILFILGLFLFNTRLRPLLLQVSTFTAAHTVTLAAASLDIVTISSAVIEPAIAASIVYIAIENIFAAGKSVFRLPVIFCFGLIHGLGFASVLQEFGLPDQNFVAALLGFNLGVEFGQIAVIGIAFLLLGAWFNRKRLYRALVVIPGSAAIGIVGAVWFIQRVS